MEEKIVSAFLKAIGLGNLRVSDIEADFDELVAGDTHLGYLSQSLKDLYLILLYCERTAALFEQQVVDQKDDSYFEEINYWSEKRDICESLLGHAIRLKFSLSYNFGIRIVEDFLVVAYEFKPERIPVSLN